MFCNQCGNNVPNEMRYCPNCGTAMHPAAQGAQPVYTPPMQEERKSRGGIVALILILAACLVLLCLLVIGLLAIFGISFHRNKEETSYNGNSVVESADGALAGNIYQNVYERYADFVLPGSDWLPMPEILTLHRNDNAGKCCAQQAAYPLLAARYRIIWVSAFARRVLPLCWKLFAMRAVWLLTLPTTWAM